MKIRPDGPIFKFTAASGESEYSAYLQADHAPARIDFGVEMVTPKAIPAPPSAAEITDYILAKRERTM